MAIIPQTRYETYLTESISSSAVTIPVSECPATGVTTGFVRIKDELIKFEGNSNPGAAGNLTSCTRGLALSGVTETTAGLGVAHQGGTKVIMSDIHYYLNNANAALAITTTGTPVANDFARFSSASEIEGRNYAEVKADLNLEIGTDVLAEQTIGIADDNLIEVDHAAAADDDYAKFTANGLEGRSYTEVKTDLSLNNVDNVADASQTSVGTISIGVWEGTDVGLAHGGTGESSAAAAFTALKQAATSAATGVVELATTAEIDTGTDSTRCMPIDQFVASKRNIRWLVFNLVEAGTDCATATNIAGDFVSPIAGTILQSDSSPFYLYATNSTAGINTGTGLVVDISLNGTTIMAANKLDFDSTEKTTTTATTKPDLTDTTIAVGDILTIDIDSIHDGTAAKGLTVYMAIRE